MYNKKIIYNTIQYNTIKVMMIMMMMMMMMIHFELKTLNSYSRGRSRGKDTGLQGELQERYSSNRLTKFNLCLSSFCEADAMSDGRLFCSIALGRLKPFLNNMLMLT